MESTGISLYISRPLLSSWRKAATAKLWRRQCRQIFLACFGRSGLSMPIYWIHFRNASLIQEHEMGFSVLEGKNQFSFWGIPLIEYIFTFSVSVLCIGTILSRFPFAFRTWIIPYSRSTSFVFSSLISFNRNPQPIYILSITLKQAAL